VDMNIIVQIKDWERKKEAAGALYRVRRRAAPGQVWSSFVHVSGNGECNVRDQCLGKRPGSRLT
jgi:hypothetical protein